MSSLIETINRYAVYIPQAKAWGFDGGVLTNYHVEVEHKRLGVVRFITHSY